MADNMNRNAEVVYLGEKGVGAKALEKDVRILSTAAVYALIEKFSTQTGLSREQFAVNYWGYPFIPVPEVRNAYGHVRIAPRNIKKRYFGHPIYWIEPTLTARRDGESEQEWCVRMFYLIDAFGYWSKEGHFVDFLKVNDFSFADTQIATYHRIADDNAETDRFDLLGKDDLQISEDAVQDNFIRARRRCFEIEKRESLKMLKTQAEKYHFAKAILGPDSDSWLATFSYEGGVWNKSVFPYLLKIATTYDSRADDGNQIISDLLKATKSVVESVEAIVEQMNEATSILELPIHASFNGRPGGSSRISIIATSMAVANRKDNLKKTAFRKIDDAVEMAFGGGNRGVTGFDQVVKSIESVYKQAWDRLRLAFVNFDNLRNGGTIYANLVEMNADLQRKATNQKGTLG